MSAESGARTRRLPVRQFRSAPPDGLLHQPAFRAYWLARLAAQTAQGALLYGLLILIVDRTEKSIYASLFVLCSIFPALLFGLVGGWAADRLPQRAFMFWLSIARTAMVAILVVTRVDLTTIFLVTLGIWIVHQFFSPVESAVMARIVDGDRLSRGSALSNLALTIAQVLGMVVLAPLLLMLPSERFLFFVCAALYALAAVYVLRMGRLEGREPSARRKPPLDLRRGWEVVSSDRPAYTAMIDAVLIGIGMSTLVVIVPHYLVRVLHTGSSNTVFVFAPAVIGLVIGLHVAPGLGRTFGDGRLATVGLIGFAASIAGLGLIDNVVRLLADLGLPLATIESRIGLSTRISATMLVSIPAGFFSALTNVAARTVLLERAPPESRGQVFATQSTISNAGALLPTLLAGVAVDAVNVRPVALSVAFLLVAFALLARRYREADETTDQTLWSVAATSDMSPADVGILRFAESAARLKTVRRQGWLDRGVRDAESSADHSWGVALLAWLLARDREDLDRDRVMLLGIVHDLPEALAGDTTPFDTERNSRGAVPRKELRRAPAYTDAARRAKVARESAALERMLDDLPTDLAGDVRSAWEEYERGETPEARFVRQVDKLETLIQAETYHAGQRNLIIDSFRLGAKRDVTDDELTRLIDAITQASPRSTSPAERPSPKRRQKDEPSGQSPTAEPVTRRSTRSD